MTGGCLCGAKRFTAEVDSDEAYLCHCRMCQRASGNVSLAFVNIARDAVTWQGEPDLFASSPFAKRGFCAACGTTLTFMYNEGSDKMDLTVAAFDEPERFEPHHHFGAESIHRAWLDTRGLPEYRTEDHAPLVERWMTHVGRLPA
jgi:hypothetical protein